MNKKNIPSKTMHIFKPLYLKDLVRLGKHSDGGYVINERIIQKTKTLIGLGICDDWSFEEDFKQRKPDLCVWGFDGSVGAFRHWFTPLRMLSAFLKMKPKRLRNRVSHALFHFRLSRRIRHFFSPARGNVFFAFWVVSEEKKNKRRHAISATQIFDLIAKKSSLDLDSCFIKMDIESAEFDVLLDVHRHSAYINSMVVEFHDLEERWEEFVQMLDTLKQDYYVTHAHINNYGGMSSDGAIPLVLELTFLKKHLVQPQEITKELPRYPLAGLDFSNRPGDEDIALRFDESLS